MFFDTLVSRCKANNLLRFARISNSVVMGIAHFKGAKPLNNPSKMNVAQDREVVQNIIESLAKLTSVELNEPRFSTCCQDVLRNCFVSGKAGVKFEDSDQKKIGSLVTKNLKSIDNFIFKIGNSFDPDRGPSALVYRSGLQFIIDNFKNFPTEQGGSLGDALTFLTESDSMETLDEALQQWKSGDSIGGDVCHSREELERPTSVPESHSWWF